MPARKHYSRNPTIFAFIDHQWQADLADVAQLEKDNDGVRYLLTVIDCLSKYAWVIPLLRKNANEIQEAFVRLFEQSAPRKPRRLQTDKGKEFLNSTVQKLFKNLDIHHFSTENETKASIVERFNRTLKTRLWAYMTANNTDRYIDALTDIVNSYNHSKHRTIGMCPADVKPKHVKKLWNSIFAKHFSRPHKPHKIDIGESVRVSKVKKPI
jgi:transposase InsO family protein